ncbi:AI-2E family transporter [Methylophaga sp. OBS4]|uniref:AI-2E family transporter n=1 Tax=Methylophaga sp. OBS4 TaxID=2991935 RepID=UPI0022505561|nr:AI-2E family transporter [Methylophaga sp. OBS4]MCX4188169.1 AI-2E family transporter [Methylophaga sp. OBS4]
MAAGQTKKMTDSNKLLIVIITIISGWLLYQLSPVLMPFFIAALFAYLGDPLVDRLENWKLSRTAAVTVVFGVLFISVSITLLVLLPLLSAQVAALFTNLPGYLTTAQQLIEPWLISAGLPTDVFNLQTLKQALNNYWSQFGQVAGGVFSYMTRSGMVLLQWLGNLVLIPVLTFYLLRDWDLLVARFRELLPRRYSDKFIEMSLECDDMLAGFIRGQLMVMLALAIIYTVGLSLIGLELALLLGVIASVVSFVPYLGLIVGIVLAGLAAFFQFGEWLPVLLVAVVFAVAQAIEGMVLTPRFVGERIGLHPVAVIFAVLAGAQLFGFTGVLLALPVAAVIMVLLRHAHQRYVGSHLYS